MAKKPPAQTGISRYIFPMIFFLLALGCAYLVILAIQGHNFTGAIAFGVGFILFVAYAIQDLRGKLGQSTFRSRY